MDTRGFGSGWRRIALALLSAPLLLSLMSGCDASSQGGGAAKLTLNIGMLANMTHAPAIVALENGTLAKDLGPDVTIKVHIFSAGPDVITALFAGAVDIAFTGPSPAVNGYQKSQGRALRVISGIAIGGAGLVVRPQADITDAQDLVGKTIGTPQLGNTQDVALRIYLLNHGIAVPSAGGGPVKIINAPNSTLFLDLQQGTIDGAWVPEPYVARAVDELGDVELVNEDTLWPDGRFPTTVLSAATGFLNTHPTVVSNVLRAIITSVDWINSNPTQAKQTINSWLQVNVGKPLLFTSMNDAFADVKFSLDPVPSAMQTDADDAVRVGLATSSDINGILDLGPLNALLSQMHQPTIGAGGLG